MLRPVELPSFPGTFQGWTIFGTYVYALCGDAYGPKNPSPGNTTLSKVDLATGLIEQTTHSNAYGSMTSREPEGMAGYIKADGEHRLYFGFVGHSGATSSTQPDGIDRPISIAYKNVFG